MECTICRNAILNHESTAQEIRIYVVGTEVVRETATGRVAHEVCSRSGLSEDQMTFSELGGTNG